MMIFSTEQNDDTRILRRLKDEEDNKIGPMQQNDLHKLCMWADTHNMKFIAKFELMRCGKEQEIKTTTILKSHDNLKPYPSESEKQFPHEYQSLSVAFTSPPQEYQRMRIAFTSPPQEYQSMRVAFTSPPQEYQSMRVAFFPSTGVYQSMRVAFVAYVMRSH